MPFGLKVLLSVDDDDAVHYMLKKAIEQIASGIRLYHVANGEEALAFLRRTGSYADAPRPSAVLLDLNMPRLNGFDVLTAIQNAPALNSIPIIVFSTSDLDSDRARSLALRAIGYITKPKDFDGFVEAVRVACSGI